MNASQPYTGAFETASPSTSSTRCVTFSTTTRYVTSLLGPHRQGLCRWLYCQEWLHALNMDVDPNDDKAKAKLNKAKTLWKELLGHTGKHNKKTDGLIVGLLHQAMKEASQSGGGEVDEVGHFC